MRLEERSVAGRSAGALASADLAGAQRVELGAGFEDVGEAANREPHIAALNDLADRIAVETGLAVPRFDPDSAGICARSLFLFEAPGARSTSTSGLRAAAKGSKIIRPDNTDGTAENMWRLHEAAGLSRTTTLAWNPGKADASKIGSDQATALKGPGDHELYRGWLPD